MSDVTRKSLEKHERDIIKLDYEKAVVVDGLGNTLILKGGAKDHVMFTQEELSVFPGNYLTHNHPQGRSFSVNDMVILKDRRLREIRIIGQRRVGADRITPELGEKILYRFTVLDDIYYEQDVSAVVDNYRKATATAKEEIDPLFYSGKLGVNDANHLVAVRTMAALVNVYNSQYDKPIVRYLEEIIK